ncbi:MAG: DUF2335 domain-containing protein [Syntrophales bacterium]
MAKNSHRRNIPMTLPNGQQVQKVAAATFSSGPLPPSSELQGYENIKEGFAERIMQMAEGESAHRHKQEEKALSTDISVTEKEFSERRIGQILAFVIVIFMASLGFYLAVTGREIAGSVFGGPAIVAIIGAFLSRKKDGNNHQ